MIQPRGFAYYAMMQQQQAEAEAAEAAAAAEAKTAKVKASKAGAAVEAAEALPNPAARGSPDAEEEPAAYEGGEEEDGGCINGGGGEVTEPQPSCGVVVGGAAAAGEKQRRKRRAARTANTSGSLRPSPAASSLEEYNGSEEAGHVERSREEEEEAAAREEVAALVGDPLGHIYGELDVAGMEADPESDADLVTELVAAASLWQQITSPEEHERYAVEYRRLHDLYFRVQQRYNAVIRQVEGFLLAIESSSDPEQREAWRLEAWHVGAEHWLLIERWAVLAPLLMQAIDGIHFEVDAYVGRLKELGGADDGSEDEGGD